MKNIILAFLVLFTFVGYAQEDEKKAFDEAREGMAQGEDIFDMEGFEQTDFSISTIFTGTDDIFNQNAGYVFGPARFQNRGLASGYTKNYINGINVNTLDRGTGAWFIWSGLNDATRNKESQNSTQFNRYSFANIGGSFNINTRASSFAPNTKITYSSSNRAYTNRLMFLYSTGMMDNGWAFTVSGTRRWAEEGYQSFLTEPLGLDHTEGTSYDSWSYFLSVEKKFNEQHSLNFTAMGAPSKRGGRTGVVQEIYDVTGNNYHNTAWGYQDGEVRNSKMTTSHQPMFILNHYWDFSKETQLNTAISYSTGLYQKTAFNWRIAFDPRPYYYRNWPYYFLGGKTPDVPEQIEQNYQANPELAQVQWDAIYQVNYDVKPDENGKKRGAFALEGRNTWKDEFAANTVFNTERGDWKINAGLQARYLRANSYNTLEDLLGADYWVDIDAFAEREFTSTSPEIQNDLNKEANRKIFKGDKYGHDYDANIVRAEAWSQAQYKIFKGLDLTFGGQFAQVEMWRDGHTKKGLFPTNSYGESAHQNFTEFMLKGGAFYKLSGQHQFELNASYGQQAPIFANVFVSPRKHNGVAPNPMEVKILSSDASYHVSLPKFKGRVTGYFSQSADEVSIRSAYYDDKKTFTNFVVSGINTIHYGVELGMEYTLMDGLKINAIASHGVHEYTDDQKMVVFKDAEFSPLHVDNVLMDGAKVSNGPQTVGSIGLKYFSYDIGFASLAVNYFDNAYISASPFRKQESFINSITNSELKAAYMHQQKLDKAFTVDASIGKFFNLGHGYKLNVSLNASNILNNTEFATGGYEQYRVPGNSDNKTEKFGSKYFYYQGFNYFLNIGLRF